jgi:hypothetical protein
MSDLDWHLKARDISNEQLIADARTLSVEILSDIRCLSPCLSPCLDTTMTFSSSEYTSASDNKTSKGSWSIVAPSISSGYALIDSNSSHLDKSRPSRSSDVSRSQCASEFRDAFQPVPRVHPWENEVLELVLDMLSSNSIESPAYPETVQETVYCDQLQQDLGLMLLQTFVPDAMHICTNYPDNYIRSWELICQPNPEVEEHRCPKCHCLNRDHSPVPHDWLLDSTSALPQGLANQTAHQSVAMNPDNGLASEFVACCYACCIYSGQGRNDLLTKCLQRANLIFEAMLLEGNSMTLLSMLLICCILHVYDQNAIAELIIRSAYLVSCHTMGKEHSVSLELEWLAAAAGQKIAQCSVKTVHLRAIYTNHQVHFGHTHQHTIVSLYCLAFSLARDEELAEAETKFTQLFEVCNRKLGKNHLQTVSTLNGLSRAQYCQGKHEAAASTLKLSVNNYPLGLLHPARLKFVRRLAEIYEKTGQFEVAERIHWDVLKDRLHTLGRTHRETESARAQLERFLKFICMWDDEETAARYRSCLTMKA